MGAAAVAAAIREDIHQTIAEYRLMMAAGACAGTPPTAAASHLEPVPTLPMTREMHHIGSLTGFRDRTALT
jgi:hypothetical protein